MIKNNKTVRLNLDQYDKKIILRNCLIIDEFSKVTIKREFSDLIFVPDKSEEELRISYINEDSILEFYFFVKELLKNEDIKISIDENITKLLIELKNQENQRLKNIERIRNLKLGNSNYFQNKKISEIKKNLKFALKLQPRPLQYESIYQHILLESACNFSVPGSGKSLMALATYIYWKKQQKVNKILIISPLGSFISWSDEYLKILSTSDKNKILRIDKNFNENELYHFLNSTSVELFLINYEKVVKFSNILKENLSKNEFFVILDEAHRIKNPEAKRSDFTKQILKKVNYKLILTGTPMPQNFGDLSIYFEIIKKKYEEKLLPFSSELKNVQKIQDIKTIVYKIEPYFYRINKNDLGLIEPRIEHWDEFQFDKEQKLIYESLEKKLFKTLSSFTGSRESAGQIFKGRIFRMMQIAIDPRMIKISKSLIENNDPQYNEIKENNSLEEFEKNAPDLTKWLPQMKSFDYQNRPPRYDYCLQKIQNLFTDNKVKKVIIWSTWIFVIEELEKLFKNEFNDKAVKVIYGGTKIEEREKIIHDFQQEKGEIKILICNPASVSESVSLHQYCWHAIYFDMTWNAVYYLQSKDRIHRLGMKPANRQVYYHIIKHKNSIDDQIWQNIFKKEEKMLAVLNNSKLEKPDYKDGIKNEIDEIFDIFWKQRLKEIKNKN